MAVEPPGDRTCGTQEAGWLSTDHPNVGDAPLPGTVCFDADDASFKDCFRQTEVLVCACSYDGGQSIKYSYKLPAPPRCYSAYCGDEDGLPPAPPIAPSPVDGGWDEHCDEQMQDEMGEKTNVKDADPDGDNDDNGDDGDDDDGISSGDGTCEGMSLDKSKYSCDQFYEEDADGRIWPCEDGAADGEPGSCTRSDDPARQEDGTPCVKPDPPSPPMPPAPPPSPPSPSPYAPGTVSPPSPPPLPPPVTPAPSAPSPVDGGWDEHCDEQMQDEMGEKTNVKDADPDGDNDGDEDDSDDDDGISSGDGTCEGMSLDKSKYSCDQFYEEDADGRIWPCTDCYWESCIEDGTSCARSDDPARQEDGTPCVTKERPPLDCLKEEFNIDLNGPYAIRDAGDCFKPPQPAHMCGEMRPAGGVFRESLAAAQEDCVKHFFDTCGCVVHMDGEEGVGYYVMHNGYTPGSADDDFNFGFPKIEAYVFDGSMDIVEGTSVVPTTYERYLGYSGIADGGCTVPEFPKDLPKPWSNLGGHGPDAPLLDVEGRQELRFYGVGLFEGSPFDLVVKVPDQDVNYDEDGKSTSYVPEDPSVNGISSYDDPANTRPGLGQISLPPSVWKYDEGSSITGDCSYSVELTFELRDSKTNTLVRSGFDDAAEEDGRGTEWYFSVFDVDGDAGFTSLQSVLGHAYDKHFLADASSVVIADSSVATIDGAPKLTTLFESCDVLRARARASTTTTSSAPRRAAGNADAPLQPMTLDAAQLGAAVTFQLKGQSYFTLKAKRQRHGAAIASADENGVVYDLPASEWMQRTDTSLDQYNDEAWAQYASEQAAAPPSGDGDLAYKPALPTAYPDARFPDWDVRGTPMCPAPGEPPLDRPRGFFVVEKVGGVERQRRVHGGGRPQCHHPDAR